MLTKKLIKNDFKMDDIYEKRMKEFFYPIENGKDKLYNALKEE